MAPTLVIATFTAGRSLMSLNQRARLQSCPLIAEPARHWLKQRGVLAELNQFFFELRKM
jgi:hypothetical protein